MNQTTCKICCVCQNVCVQYVEFPGKSSDPEKRNKWLEALNFTEDNLKLRFNFVCHKHFLPNDFGKDGHLKSKVLPSVKDVSGSNSASGSSDATNNIPVVCGVIVKQEAAEGTDFNPCDVSRLNALGDDVRDQDRDIGGEYIDDSSLAINKPSTTRTGQIYSPHGIKVKTEIKSEPDDDNDTDKVNPGCSRLDLSPGKRENSGDVGNPSSPKMSRTSSSADNTSDVTSSRDDTNRECSVCLQPFCHPIKLPCGHIFCYLCAKGFANQHGRCAFCRAVIPPGYMNIPELMNDLSVQDTRTETKYTWFYEGRNGWWQFEERLSDEVEQQYSQSATQCDVLISGFLYTIDFQGMIQFRKDRPQRIRRIKRDILSAPSKGIAGIRNDLMQGRAV